MTAKIKVPSYGVVINLTATERTCYIPAVGEKPSQVVHIDKLCKELRPGEKQTEHNQFIGQLCDLCA